MEKIIHEDILGVRFDAVTLNGAVALAISWAKEGLKSDQRIIVTPNPEMVLEAQKNPHFKNILNKADLSLADGSGILLASRLIKSHVPIKERVTGIDFMKSFLVASKSESIPIFLLGADTGIAEQVKEKMTKMHEGINIVGTFSGTPKDEDFEEIKSKIQQTRPAALFVAFGAPNQELWIAKHIHELTSVKVAIGVGGAFDFIAGKRRRAPKWMRRLNLEWIYRLIQEPRRIKRIINATIVFPIKVLTNYFFYNAAK